MNTDTGRFALLRQLRAANVDCMFGNPGTSEQNLLDALRDPEFASFRYYLALHEGTAVAMADAYARAARGTAVVQLHSYAGLANGLGMMYYAKRGYTPMVVLAGEAGLRYDAMDGQMAADLVTMARPFVKYDNNGPCAWRAVHSGSLLRLVRRALKAAATPPMGPVFLALPMDVLDEVNTEVPAPVEAVRSEVVPDDKTIAAAADLLSSAQRPLIVMGDGVAAAGAQAELARVAELLGARVWGANNSEVNLPASHPLFAGDLGHMFGADSRGVLSQPDVLLVCGTTLLPEVFPDFDGVFASGARIVHFDLNTSEIGKNFPVAIGALAEPRAALAALGQALETRLSPKQRAAAEETSGREKAARAERRRVALEADASRADQIPLHAPRFLTELKPRLEGHTNHPLVFDEALTHSPEVTRYISRDVPGSYFQTRAGMLGTGLPGTLGLKVAHPERLVVGFVGDGGAISSIQALATAARHGIGAKIVVCNNRSYRILKYNLQQYRRTLGVPANDPFPDSFDLVRPELRFDTLAEGQGVAAARVTRPDEIAPALDRAFKDDAPFLIDLVLDNAL